MAYKFANIIGCQVLVYGVDLYYVVLNEALGGSAGREAVGYGIS